MKRTRLNRGQGLVEFALILPLFIFLVMGIIDLGLALGKKHTADEISTVLARSASLMAAQEELFSRSEELIQTLDPVTGGQAAEETEADGTTVTKFAFTTEDGRQITVQFIPSLSGRTKGEELEVSIEYVYEPITPLVDSFGSIEIVSTRITLVEGN